MTQITRSVTVQVDQIPGVGLRITTQGARGWAAVARNPHQLAHAMAQALTEAETAAYARARQEVYDLDAMTMAVAGDPLTANPGRLPRRPPGSGPKRATLPPEAWTRLDERTWLSPGGRRYREETPVVQRVIARRMELGLAT